MVAIAIDVHGILNGTGDADCCCCGGKDTTNNVTGAVLLTARSTDTTDTDSGYNKDSTVKGTVLLLKARSMTLRVTQTIEAQLTKKLSTTAKARAVQSMSTTWCSKTHLASHRIQHDDTVWSERGSVRYLLHDELGKGTFGQVVRAQKEELRHSCSHRGCRYEYTDVAIKIQPSRRQNDPIYTDRLKLECEILRRFGHHTNIIGLVEVIHTTCFPCKVYIVMEKASTDLFTLLTKSNAFAAQADLPQQIMIGLLTAVAYLHEAGIAHRDIKLENILIQCSCLSLSHQIHPGGRIEACAVRLCDFGLASEARYYPGYRYSSRSHVGQYDKRGWFQDGGKEVLAWGTQGTPRYQSPELLSKQRRKMKRPFEARRADMYSTGCLLYVIIFRKYYDRKSWRCKRLLFEDESEMPEKHRVGILLQSLLRTEPCARISAAAALKHSWFQHTKSK